ncbi:hypothetical protein ACA910_008674 [Epithemia clementina (nom. ined.)]
MAKSVSPLQEERGASGSKLDTTASRNQNSNNSIINSASSSNYNNNMLSFFPSSSSSASASLTDLENHHVVNGAERSSTSFHNQQQQYHHHHHSCHGKNNLPGTNNNNDTKKDNNALSSGGEGEGSGDETLDSERQQNCSSPTESSSPWDSISPSIFQSTPSPASSSSSSSLPKMPPASQRPPWCHGISSPTSEEEEASSSEEKFDSEQQQQQQQDHDYGDDHHKNNNNNYDYDDKFDSNGMPSIPPPPPPPSYSTLSPKLTCRSSPKQDHVPTTVNCTSRRNGSHKLKSVTEHEISMMESILGLLRQSASSTSAEKEDDDDHHHHEDDLSSPSLLLKNERTPLFSSSWTKRIDSGRFARTPFGGSLLDHRGGSDKDDSLVIDAQPKSPSRAALSWEKVQTKVHSGDLLLRSYSGLDPQAAAAAGLAATTTTTTTTTMEQGQPPKSSLAKRAEAQESLRSGLDFSLTQCLLVFLLFMALSVAAFCFWLDRWTWIDAMYFAVVTCTTVGYGDLVPDSFSGRIFTCLYALAGVCFLGIALGVLGNHMVEAQEAAVEQTSTVAKKRILSLFGAEQAAEVTTSTVEGALESGTAPPPDTVDHNKTLVVDAKKQEEEEDQLFAEQIEQQEHPQSSSQSILWHLLVHFLLIMVLLAMFAFCISQDSGIEMSGGDPDLFDAFYFTIVTATTVGYGDYSPESQKGRLIAIFFIPLSVGAMGHFLSSVAEAIMERRAEAVRRQFAAREMSLQDLEIMDADGDGKVTRAEFLEFMLVAMDKVDHDFIDEMRRHFAKLDVDGTGVLEKHDLIEHARRKLGRIQRKLELANYKEYLLRQAAAQRRRRRRSGKLWMTALAPNHLAGNLEKQFRRATSFLTASIRSNHHHHQQQQQPAQHNPFHHPSRRTPQHPNPQQQYRPREEQQQELQNHDHQPPQTYHSSMAAAAAAAAASGFGRFSGISFASSMTEDAFEDDDDDPNETGVSLSYGGSDHSWRSAGIHPGGGGGGGGSMAGNTTSGLPTLHEQQGVVNEEEEDDDDET